MTLKQITRSKEMGWGVGGGGGGGRMQVSCTLHFMGSKRYIDILKKK